MNPAPLSQNGPLFTRSLSISAFFVLVEAMLAALTDVKLGPFQLAEMVGLITLPFAGWDIAHWRTGVAVTGDGWRPHWFILFMLLAAVGATTAYLTETFVIPADATSFVKQPGWLSAARLTQFLFAYITAFVIVKVCARWETVFAKGLYVYVLAAAVSSTYGIVSFMLAKLAGITLSGAYDTGDGLRLRSFFVEGGPFGLYALSGLVVLFTLRRRNRISPRSSATLAGIILVGFLLSQSKAATLAGVLVLLISLAISNGAAFRKYWKLILVFLVFVTISAIATGAAVILDTILDSREALTLTPEIFGDDPNVVMGRIAGSVIVPEMISRHPLMGVGIGNYSLLRDSSIYNPLLPAVNAWDLHGLGLYGLTAEIGVLGMLALILVMTGPVLAARRLPQSLDLVALSCFPLIAFLFGTQPTFLYPWVVYAFAIASNRQAKRQREEPAAP